MLAVPLVAYGNRNNKYMNCITIKRMHALTLTRTHTRTYTHTHAHTHTHTHTRTHTHAHTHNGTCVQYDTCGSIVLIKICKVYSPDMLWSYYTEDILIQYITTIL